MDEYAANIDFKQYVCSTHLKRQNDSLYGWEMDEWMGAGQVDGGQTNGWCWRLLDRCRYGSMVRMASKDFTKLLGELL